MTNPASVGVLATVPTRAHWGRAFVAASLLGAWLLWLRQPVGDTPRPMHRLPTVEQYQAWRRSDLVGALGASGLNVPAEEVQVRAAMAVYNWLGYNDAWAFAERRYATDVGPFRLDALASERVWEVAPPALPPAETDWARAVGVAASAVLSEFAHELQVLSVTHTQTRTLRTARAHANDRLTGAAIGAFSLAVVAFVGWARRRPVQVSVTAHHLQIDQRRFAWEEVVVSSWDPLVATHGETTLRLPHHLLNKPDQQALAAAARCASHPRDPLDLVAHNALWTLQHRSGVEPQQDAAHPCEREQQ